MHSLWPVLALLFNALVWGVSWWPLRALHEAGLHPLWATALTYGMAWLSLLVLRPHAGRGACQYPGLWWLALASGLTNMCFNWAVSVGDVVRVVLLFYLMPAWSVLLAWRLLGERPSTTAWLRLLLALLGVALVIWPHEAALAGLAADLSIADGLAIAGGFFFALTNVMLRRLRDVPDPARMVAMFGGGTLLSALGAVLGLLVGGVAAPPALASGWVLIASVLTLAFLLGNYALQVGAARLPASTTALIMLTEVVFASVSSVLLGATVLTPRTLAGGALIILAALLALWPTRPSASEALTTTP